MMRRSQKAMVGNSTGGARVTAGTQLVVEDESKQELVALPIDMNDTRARAEQLGGDPVHRMVLLIEGVLANAQISLRAGGRAALERTLEKSIINEAWPPRITLEGMTVFKVLKERATSPRVTAGSHTDRKWPPDLFEERLSYPEPDSRERFSSLIGLDDQKESLIKEATLLARPTQLVDWAKRHHRHNGKKLATEFAHGAPLFIFAGDVGTGKTALAESFPDAVARALGESVYLFRLSLQTRGSGIVGQMSEQITKAFAFVEAEARATNTVTVLLLDEADSITASRETPQMHHEDRAGVNAVIQGLDRLRRPDVPAVVVFCTNRGTALDPAVRRRAMHYFEFQRPNDAQRESLLRDRLDGYVITPEEMARLVALTGPRSPGGPGFTYSDLTDRLLRSSVLRAYPNETLTGALLCQVAERLAPTPTFGDGVAGAGT